MSSPLTVTVWGEGFLDLSTLGNEVEPLNYRGYVEEARRLYPEDIHCTIAAFLHQLLPEANVRTSTLEEPEAGLAHALLNETDVLVWWSHVKHHLVPEEAVERLWERVRDGMGLVMLHAGTESAIFRRLLGTSCKPGGWRQSDDWEAVWTVSPGHPIASGVPPVFVIEQEEAYSEIFDIPSPDELVFLSTFRGGEVFRSGCCWHRGNGRIFYFRPGHESHPTFYNAHVQRVLANAVRWAAREAGATTPLAPSSSPDPEAIKKRELRDGWFRGAEAVDHSETNS